MAWRSASYCASGGLTGGPFTAAEAETRAAAGQKVILVRKETSPEDIRGMAAAQAILTQRGGMTSHAAVVARGMGKCCVAGCGGISLDEAAGLMRVNGTAYKRGERLTLNGTTGEVIEGEVPLAELEGYESRLKSLTGGEGSYTIELSHYAPVPGNVQQQLAAAYQRASDD